MNKIHSVFIYTREAHPGEIRPAHESVDQKLTNARDMAERFSITRPMLVDDLEGTVHRAYGSLPNMTYIVGRGGTIVYRADWTDARTIGMVLDQIRFQREAVRSRTRMNPFYVEWMPMRDASTEPFLEVLVEVAGERAVEEFIAAFDHTYGASSSKQMKSWWADHSGGS